MSNIEPTEEQRQAAREFYDGPDADRMTEALARLLAEREAKLWEEVATLNANNDQLVRALDEGGFCYPASNVPRFTVHDRLKSSGDWYDPATSRILHMDPAKAFAMKDENDTLWARVAELEAKQARLKHLANDEVAACGVHIDSLEKLLAASTDREAQHLADIKALKDDAFHRHVACVGGCSVCDLNSGARCSLMQRLAHYDDAKADAPATCPKCTDDARPVGDGERWVCSVCRRPCRVPLNDAEGGEG